MKTKILLTLSLIFLLLFILAKLVVAEEIQFVPKVSQSAPYLVYKGDSTNILFSIQNNQPSTTISCVVNSDNADINPSSQTIQQIFYSQVGTLSFRYNAPTKIKSFMGKTIPIKFSTTCKGNIPYKCGFLNLYTCNDITTSTPFPASPDTTAQINLELSPQDKQNLAILENYRQIISDKLTSTDSNLKTLKDLIDKTPSLLLPSESSEIYNNGKKNFDYANNKFNKVISYLNDEIYDYPSDYTNPDSDLQWLGDIDSSASYLTNEITSNINIYKELEKSFNEETLRSNELIKPYSIKSNSDIIDSYNSLTNSLKSKFESYQFSSLDETRSSIEDYKISYNNFISELKDREKEKLKVGLSTLKKELNSLPSNFITGGIIEDNNDLRLNELCNKYGDSKQKVDKNNQEVYSEADNILKKLPYNTNSLNSNEKVEIYQSLNENVTLTSLNDEKEIKNAIKEVNGIGKRIDLSDYSKLVERYNSADLADKKLLLEEINNEKENILEQNKNIILNENGFFLIFKKIYYSIFGEKQDIEGLSSQEIDKLIILSPEFTGFYSDNCNTLELKTNSAASQNISIIKQQSDININTTHVQETCIDENGQRTTNCCNSDDYRNREDLYPVVFVHGHAFETENNPIQEELRTFDYMSNYFKSNGYIEGGFLYPESAAQLSKGVWAYCKPVVFQITYYEGITNGVPAQYNYKSSIAGYSPVLKKEIDNILTATNKDKAVIVAHSMGGIISRYYILNGGQSKIDKLITIATPNYGTVDAVNFGANYLGGKNESKEMGQGSDFLKKLNYPQDSLVDSYTLVGNISRVPIKLGTYCTHCDGVVYATTAQLREARNNFVFINKTPQWDSYSHSKIYKQQDVAQKVLEIIRN